jgi:hypothetical protein
MHSCLQKFDKESKNAEVSVYAFWWHDAFIVWEMLVIGFLWSARKNGIHAPLQFNTLITGLKILNIAECNTPFAKNYIMQTFKCTIQYTATYKRKSQDQQESYTVGTLSPVVKQPGCKAHLPLALRLRMTKDEHLFPNPASWYGIY